MTDKQASDQPVFFILGCVRSGTTLLRDILKSHPNLVCPEETHLFRWSDPFASRDFNHVHKNVETLKMHRKMDGIDEPSFNQILEQSNDRKEFFLKYLELFKKNHNNTSKRCFDKTPQNVYGLALINAYFPQAKIIHIVRNPLNVISSLKRGRGLMPQSLISAINFWKESLLIINSMKPILKNRLHEFKYEDLTRNPKIEISHLLSFLGEKQVDMSQALAHVKTNEDSYPTVLDTNELITAKSQLFDLMKIYGYH